MTVALILASLAVCAAPWLLLACRVDWRRMRERVQRRVKWLRVAWRQMPAESKSDAAVIAFFCATYALVLLLTGGF